MFDPGVAVLLSALVLAPVPRDGGPPAVLEPTPPSEAPCVAQVVSSLYLGGPLQPCPEPSTPRPRGLLEPPPFVPLERPGPPAHSASDE